MATGESYAVPAKIETFQTTPQEQGLPGTSGSDCHFSNNGGNYDRSRSILERLECTVDNVGDAKPLPIQRISDESFVGKSRPVQRGGGSSVLGGKPKKRTRSPSNASNTEGNDEKRIRSSGTRNADGKRFKSDEGVAKSEGEYSGSLLDHPETFEKNDNDDDLLIDYENCTVCELCPDITVFSNIGSKIKHLLHIHKIDVSGYCCICKKMRGNRKNISRHFLRRHNITNVRDLPFHRILREERKKNKQKEYDAFVKNMNKKN